MNQYSLIFLVEHVFSIFRLPKTSIALVAHVDSKLRFCGRPVSPLQVTIVDQAWNKPFARLVWDAYDLQSKHGNNTTCSKELLVCNFRCLLRFVIKYNV